MRNIKDANRNLIHYNNFIWFVQFVLYGYVNGFMFLYPVSHPLLRSIARFDTVMSFMQFLLYLVYRKTEPNEREINRMMTQGIR